MNFIRKVATKLKEGYLREIIQELLWIYRYVSRYYKQIILYMLLGIMASALALGNSLLSRELTAAVMEIGTAGRYVALLAAAYVAIGLASIGLGALNSRISAKISLKVSNEMQADVFRKFLRADWMSLQKHHSGDLLNRLMGDVGTVSGSVLGLIPSLVISLFQFAASLVIILMYDPVMALLALLSAPITIIASRALIKKMRMHQKRMRAAGSDLMSFYEESLQNVQTIKSFGLIDLFSKRLLGVQGKYRDSGLDYNLFNVKMSAFMSFVGRAVSYVCLAWGVYRLWTGYIDLALMLMFLQLAGLLSSSFSSLISIVPNVISSTVAARRVLEILELPAEPEPDEKTQQTINKLQSVGSVSGLELELRDISFSYRADAPVLSGVNLSAQPGEIIALIGASGDGKTTLLRLMLSLMDPQCGEAFVAAGGSSLPLSPATRQLFSYVPQTKAVFSGSIADTMRMLKPEASDDEIYAALKTACAYDFVMRLPEGINTPLGEQGAGLSEGQNQRLSIARALLREAPILLLDEATSALDAETEAKVLRNLMSGAQKRICIITSHRPSVVSMCSQVYAIRDSRLEEIGGEKLKDSYAGDVSEGRL